MNDRHSRPPVPLRILLVVPEEACWSRTGGGQRSQLLHRALSSLGEVDLVVVTEGPRRQETQLVARLQEEFGTPRVRLMRSTPMFVYPSQKGPASYRRLSFAVRRAWAALQPRRRRFEPTTEARRALAAMVRDGGHGLVVGRYLRSTAVSGALAQTEAPVLCDLDDLDEVLVGSRIAALTRAPFRQRLERYRLRETLEIVPRLRARCRHVWVASEADLPLLSHPSASVLPNVPFFVAPANHGLAPRDSHRVALFVGSFSHTANRDGLIDFVRSCWPSISERSAGAQLRIVGSGGWDAMAATLKQFEGVHVVGEVADLAREYASASIAVVPVKEGAGTKIKVVEALAHARPAVAFDHAARGYERLVGHGLVTAGSDQDMVDRCVELLADPSRCEALGAEGRALADSLFSRDRFRREVVEATLRVLGAKDDRRDSSPPFDSRPGGRR